MSTDKLAQAIMMPQQHQDLLIRRSHQAMLNADEICSPHHLCSKSIVIIKPNTRFDVMLLLS